MKTNQSGFSLIELIIVVGVIAIISAIAIPNLLAARRTANESSAAASVRAVIQAQVTYRDSVGNTSYGSLTELRNQSLIDPNLGSGSKSGYNFTVSAIPAISTRLSLFDVTATPIILGQTATATGSRNYYANEGGAIYFNIAATPPTANNLNDRTVINGMPLS